MNGMSPLPESEEMKDRIRKIRKSNHLSQVELAKRLGVSQSVISLIESGNASVSIEILKKLSAQFDVSCDWLIYGRDQYVRLSTENEFVPMVNAEAEAGYVSNHHDPNYSSSLDLYKIPGFEKGDFRIFMVSGDSMTPTVHPHDKIIVERLRGIEALVEGTVNVVVTPKNIVVKRLYFHSKDRNSIVLKSDNRHYSEEVLSREDVKEVWVVRAKLTSSFVDDSYGQNERMENLERDLESIRSQVSTLLKRTTDGNGAAPGSIKEIAQSANLGENHEESNGTPEKAAAGVFNKKKNN